MEQGLAEFSAQSPSSGSHGHFPSTGNKKVGSACWLEEGYCGSTPEDLRAKSSIPLGYPAISRSRWSRHFMILFYFFLGLLRQGSAMQPRLDLN